MCVAILVPQGKTVPNDRLYAGWERNKDGGGFAYVNDGKVRIQKGFMTYNEFNKALTTAMEKYSKDSPFLVHMRITTSGGTTKDNTHPFKIKGGAMIHNGVLFTPTGKESAGKSDTRIFTEKLHNILRLEHVLKTKDELQFAIGDHNKLVFLYDNKDYVIINEKEGNWHDGVWYSNRACDVRPTYPSQRYNSTKE